MEPSSSSSIHDHNSTLGREIAPCSHPLRYNTCISDMEQTSRSHYDFTRKSMNTLRHRPLVQHHSRSDPSAVGREDSMHRSSPSSEIPKWEMHPNASAFSRSSAVEENPCAFEPCIAPPPAFAEIYPRGASRATGSTAVVAPTPLPCVATMQPPSCSYRDCVYYHSYYQSYQHHSAGYCAPYHHHHHYTTPWTPTNQDGPPIFRRRISDDSPRPSVITLSRNLARGAMGQSSSIPLGEEGIVDSCDVEIERITRKRGHDQTLSHAQFERPQSLSHSAAAVSFLNHPYSGCYDRPYTPLLPGPSPTTSHYYHPYHSPSPMPPVYHHYPNTCFQDPMYMYSYYCNPNPYHPESYPFYPPPAEDTHSRKRKRCDDFLLRPHQDYIIYADRCSSPMSDITGSPTPSLSGFEQVEELGRIDKDDLVVNVDSPPVEWDIVPPRIERSVMDSSVKYTFEPRQESRDFVRTVSPIKPKGGEGINNEREARDVGRKGKNEVANCEKNFLATIANNISQSSSEQWETEDVFDRK